MKSSVHRPARLRTGARPLRRELPRDAWVGVLIAGSGDEAFCANGTAEAAGAAFDSQHRSGRTASPMPQIPTITTTGSRTSLVLKLARAALPGPVAGDRSSSNHFAARRLNIHCHGHALNRRRNRQPCCTAQQKAARALHRAAPDTTADCAVPPLSHQSTKPEMVASKRNNIGRQWRRGPRRARPRDGHAGIRPLN